jgi:beta-lactam-binding protein with PASTA domain
VGIVVSELPGVGARLSSYDTVRLAVTKATKGVIPNVVGRVEARARARLTAAHLVPVVVERTVKGKPGRVVSQRPAAGVAGKPGMRVRVVVSRRPAQAG